MFSANVEVFGGRTSQNRSFLYVNNNNIKNVKCIGIQVTSLSQSIKVHRSTSYEIHAACHSFFLFLSHREFPGSLASLTALLYNILNNRRYITVRRNQAEIILCTPLYRENIVRKIIEYLHANETETAKNRIH